MIWNKIVAISVLSLFSYFGFTQASIDDIRNRFENAKNEDDFRWVINTKLKETNPEKLNIIQAYQAVSLSALAQYTYNPYTKYSVFNKGKDKLEKTIQYKKDVENIFLRLVIQLSIPKFLGYYKNIESDLAYLKQNLPKSGIPLETKKFIVQTILNTGNTEYDVKSLSLLTLEARNLEI